MENRIHSIIAQGEGPTVEFKRCESQLPANVFETVCSFLNRSGGQILLGVEDNGTISGVHESSIQSIIKDFTNLTNNPQKLYPTFYLEVNQVQIDGKNVLSIFVPEGSEVHKTAGKIFDRGEDGDFDISNNQSRVQELYIRKSTVFSETRIFPHITINDLRSDLIVQIRQMASGVRANHPWLALDDSTLLQSAGLYRRDFSTGQEGYTLGCALLVGTDELIASIAPWYRTDVIIRTNNEGRFNERLDLRTNLLSSYQQIMDFVAKHFFEDYIFVGTSRINVRDILFRELVVNALIHREFSSHHPARVLIESGLVTVENANKPHGMMQMSGEGFLPYPKNPIIARVFHEIGLAEEIGSGVRTIHEYCRHYFESSPEFSNDGLFTVTMVINKPAVALFEFDKSAETGDKSAETGDKSAETGDKSAETGDKLAPSRTQIVIDYIRAHGSVSNANVRELYGIESSAANEFLGKLCEQGVLVPRGDYKARKYYLPDGDGKAV